MPGSTQLLATAIAAYRAGDKTQAFQLCQSALALTPGDGGTLNLAAILALERGDTGTAVDFSRRAVAADGRNALFRAAHGRALSAAGQFADAEQQLRIALKAQPKLAEANADLAFVLIKQGKFGEAEAAYRRQITQQPRVAAAHAGLGHALVELGRLEAAETALRKALEIEPRYVTALINLGYVHAQRGDAKGAVDNYLRALEVDPQSVMALNNLGKIYADIEQHEEAIQCFRTAMLIQPDLPRLHTNLATSLRKLAKFAEAREGFRCALALDPREHEAEIGLGSVADAEGRLEEAIHHYERALAIVPTHGGAKHNLGLSALRNRDFARGWDAYEARWQVNEIARNKRDFRQPHWTGAFDQDRTLLAWGEQGVGDEIFYAGMVPDLRARGQRLMLECDPRLVPLFRRSWPDLDVVARTTPADAACKDPAIAWQAPLGSLGRWLRPDIKNIPAATPYLVADPEKKRALRARLDAHPNAKRLVVGISWKGPLAAYPAEKSSSLADWKPILKTKDVQFVDLQYGDTAADRAAAAKATGITVTHLEDLDARQQLDELAALIAACDAVITVSNTTAHLAGALGVPTWVLVPKGNGRIWYWFKDDGPSPWYPAVRLFQQKNPGDWKPLIAAAAEALKTFRKS